MDKMEPDPSSCHRSHSTQLLAMADEAGAIRIYNFPCVSKQVSSEQMGISGHQGDEQKWLDDYIN